MKDFRGHYTHVQGVARFSGRTITSTSDPIIPMLSWTLTFLVIALIAAILGFGVLAGTAVAIAKVIFLVFLVMFVISFLMGRRMPRA